MEKEKVVFLESEVPSVNVLLFDILWTPPSSVFSISKTLFCVHNEIHWTCFIGKYILLHSPHSRLFYTLLTLTASLDDLIPEVEEYEI